MRSLRISYLNKNRKHLRLHFWKNDIPFCTFDTFPIRYLCFDIEFERIRVKYIKKISLFLIKNLYIPGPKLNEQYYSQTIFEKSRTFFIPFTLNLSFNYMVLRVSSILIWNRSFYKGKTFTELVFKLYIQKLKLGMRLIIKSK
jgi:hypothetical protein